MELFFNENQASVNVVKNVRDCVLLVFDSAHHYVCPSVCLCVRPDVAYTSDALWSPTKKIIYVTWSKL